MSLPILPLKVEDYCSEFTSDLSAPPLDLSPDAEYAPEIGRPRRLSNSSVGTIPSPITPTFPQSSRDELDDCWNLIPYNVPWGNNYHNYEYGTLPGPEGACIFLRSPTPVKNQRTSQACKKCRERKAKVRPVTVSEYFAVLISVFRVQCSGTRPSCERCLARGHTCVYVDDPKRVRRTVSGTSLETQSRSVSNSGRTPPQLITVESPLDDVRYSSPCSPLMGILPMEPDSEAEFHAAVELTHEDPYGGGYSSVMQLPETPYMLSIQSAALDQQIDTPPSSVLSPQPMRYPQLVPLLSISIPGGDEVPALESTSSSPESPSSQSTPLLGYQPGLYHNSFVGDEFGYDRCVFPLLVIISRLSLTIVTRRSTHFQGYCIPRSIQYPQFDQAPLVLPMSCSFDESSHQVYTVGSNGEHPSLSTEGLSHPYNEEFLVRPQFVPY